MSTRVLTPCLCAVALLLMAAKPPDLPIDDKVQCEESCPGLRSDAGPIPAGAIEIEEPCIGEPPTAEVIDACSPCLFEAFHAWLKSCNAATRAAAASQPCATGGSFHQPPRGFPCVPRPRTLTVPQATGAARADWQGEILQAEYITTAPNVRISKQPYFLKTRRLVLDPCEVNGVKYRVVLVMEEESTDSSPSPALRNGGTRGCKPMKKCCSCLREIARMAWGDLKYSVKETVAGRAPAPIYAPTPVYTVPRRETSQADHSHSAPAPADSAATCPYLKQKSAEKKTPPVSAQDLPNSVLENLEKLTQAQQLLKKAEHCQRTGQPDKAGDLYKKIQDLCPGSRFDLLAGQRLEEMNANKPTETTPAIGEEEENSSDQARRPEKLTTRTYQVAELVIPVENLNICNPGSKPKTLEGALIKLITTTIAPKSWSDAGGAGTIEYVPLGMGLVIAQTPEIQQQVEELLASLRRLQDYEVALEVRFVTVPESALKSSGIACPTTDKTVQLNDIQVFQLMEACQGNRRANIRQAPKITMFNGQVAQVMNAGAFSLTTQPVIASDRSFVRVAVTVADPKEWKISKTLKIADGGTALLNCSRSDEAMLHLLMVTPRIICNEQEEVDQQVGEEQEGSATSKGKHTGQSLSAGVLDDLQKLERVRKLYFKAEHYRRTGQPEQARHLYKIMQHLCPEGCYGQVARERLQQLKEETAPETGEEQNEPACQKHSRKSGACGNCCEKQAPCQKANRKNCQSGQCGEEQESLCQKANRKNCQSGKCGDKKECCPCDKANRKNCQSGKCGDKQECCPCEKANRKNCQSGQCGEEQESPCQKANRKNCQSGKCGEATECCPCDKANCKNCHSGECGGKKGPQKPNRQKGAPVKCGDEDPIESGEEQQDPPCSKLSQPGPCVEEQVAELLEECQRAMTDGRYDEAEKLAQQAQDLDPRCVAAHALVYKTHLLIQLQEKRRQASNTPKATPPQPPLRKGGRAAAAPNACGSAHTVIILQGPDDDFEIFVDGLLEQDNGAHLREVPRLYRQAVLDVAEEQDDLAPPSIPNVYVEPLPDNLCTEQIANCHADPGPATIGQALDELIEQLQEGSYLDVEIDASRPNVVRVQCEICVGDALYRFVSDNGSVRFVRVDYSTPDEDLRTMQRDHNDAMIEWINGLGECEKPGCEWIDWPCGPDCR